MMSSSSSSFIFFLIAACFLRVTWTDESQARIAYLGEIANLASNNSECFVETVLRKSQGLIIKDRMPDKFSGKGSCRTTLRSADGRKLRIKLDFVIFKSDDDFMQISADSNLWYIHKSCAPCHEDAIVAETINVEFRLTNNSKMQIRYSTREESCPPVEILPPLRLKNKTTFGRRQGDSFEVECITQKDFILEGERTVSCVRSKDGSTRWNASLPSCKKNHNCPPLVKNDERSGFLRLDELKVGASYHCVWRIEAAEGADFVYFTPIYEPRALGDPTISNRNSGLAFYDGEGQLRVESGVGLRYRSRDRHLHVYLNLSPKDVFKNRLGSLNLTYESSVKTCPTIDGEAFPLGEMKFTDGHFIGSTVEFKCFDDHTLKGSARAHCQPDAHWSFDAMPECANYSRKDPEVVGGQVRLGSDLRVTDVHEIPAPVGGQQSTTEGIPVIGNVGQDARPVTESGIVTKNQNDGEERAVTPETIDSSPLKIPKILGDPRSDTLIVISASIASLILVVTLATFCAVRACTSRVTIRENPLYEGEAPRRLNNISFRSNSKSERMKQSIQRRTFT